VPSPSLCNLAAFDPIGGQAIFQQGDRWYRVCADDDWNPKELLDGRSAMRCVLLAQYEARHRHFNDVDSLIGDVSTEWRNQFQVQDVPLADVIHLFAEELQRAWGARQQEQKAQADRLTNQARRHRKPKPNHTKRLRLGYLLRWDTLKWPTSTQLPATGAESSIWQDIVRFASTAARSYKGQAADLEDLAAAATLRLWIGAHAKTTEPQVHRGQLKALAARVVHLTAADSMHRELSAKRRGGRHQVAQSAFETVVDPESLQPVDFVSRIEVQEAIAAALQKLPQEDWAVAREFVEHITSTPSHPSLTTPSQHSLRMVAKKFGWTADKARMRWGKIRKSLADELRRLGLDPSADA
jgi:hypothetical protein